MLTLDGKGRLVVPAKWRELLQEHAQGRLVITRDQADCLGLYPPGAWAQLEAVVSKLPDEYQHWRRLYLGNAVDVEIDSASRILVPPELRRHAELKEGEEVKFMGVGAYFELWNPARYDAAEAQVRTQGRPEALRSLVIE